MVCKWKLLAAACIALSGLPANADESKPWVLPHASNWYGYHGGYAHPSLNPVLECPLRHPYPRPAQSNGHAIARGSRRTERLIRDERAR